jgi:hypothetical protein
VNKIAALAFYADANDSGGSAWGGFFLLIIGALMYLLPTIIASSRHVRNVGSVAVINLFLGWTLIGWVVALAMAVRTVDRTDHE